MKILVLSGVSLRVRREKNGRNVMADIDAGPVEPVYCMTRIAESLEIGVVRGVCFCMPDDESSHDMYQRGRVKKAILIHLRYEIMSIFFEAQAMFGADEGRYLNGFSMANGYRRPHVDVGFTKASRRWRESLAGEPASRFPHLEEFNRKKSTYAHYR